MIRIGNDKINELYDGNTSINKAYYGGKNVFIRYASSSPGVQRPCFGVTDDILSYSDREYLDVYDLTSNKWYKLNNLNAYEEYGVYGKGLDITKYVGKLTVDNGIEYQWDGVKWNKVGEGIMSQYELPDVPFTLNYNAKDYDENTYTIKKTEGQLNGVDAVITGDTGQIIYNGDFLRINGNVRSLISGNDISYFNRNSSNPNITIISKARGSGLPYILSNRDSTYNWMYRQYSNYLTMHFTSEKGNIGCSSVEPNILSVRVDSNSNITYNNWTEGISSQGGTGNYGSPTTNGAALFCGYSSSDSEYFRGDFYWIYMTQNTLTDDEVQQVIGYNENFNFVDVTVKYDVIEKPTNNVSFNTMDDMLTYKCPWVGMIAFIGNKKYQFSEDYEWIELNEYFTVDLQNQWRQSTSFGNIIDTDEYLFYESFSNYHIGNGIASMIITIDGYNSFTFKVRNYSENNWDYVVVNNLDDLSTPKWQPNYIGNGLASNGYVYYSNKSLASNTQWYDVTFSNLDGGEHKIMVSYGKDSGGDTNDDKGYVAIPVVCDNAEYRWVESDDTICVEGNLYTTEKEQKSCNGGAWIYTGGERQGRLIEEDSDSCKGKIVVTFQNGNVKNLECDGNPLEKSDINSLISYNEASSENTFTASVNCVDKIGDYVFGQNTSTLRYMTSLTLPEGLKVIGHEAFMELYMLDTLTIPSTVTEIGFWAFTRLTGMEECILLPDTPPQVTGSQSSDNVFHDYVPPVIWVKDESLEQYKTTSPWNKNASVYRPLSERN